MEEIGFKVSARSAQLIGRENISTDIGAIIELVKNAYDADSKTCIVYIKRKFEITPSEIPIQDFEKLCKIENNLKKNYSRKGNLYFINEHDINSKEKIKLNNFFRNLGELYIIDNGEGMDDSIIKNQWMLIGTNCKKYDYQSHEFKRIKTGAKGIGRFALDKLGKNTNMITFHKKSLKTFNWIVDWKQFVEKEGAEIGDIKAKLGEINNLNYYEKMKEILSNKNMKDFNKEDFQSGTLIKITGLNSNWTKTKSLQLYDELSKLNPPVNNGFKIYLYSDLVKEKLGEVKKNENSEYDYKINCSFISETGEIKLTIKRNEFDTGLLEDNEFFSNRLESEDLKRSLKNYSDDEKKYLKRRYFEKPFEINKNLEKDFNLLIEDGKKLGDFNFTFCFLKNKIEKKDREKFCYKQFDNVYRREEIKNFAGVKIYRDNFKVRPYGETNTEYFDWLFLDRRYREYGFPIGHKTGGAWRLTGKQIIGNVSISRIANPKIEDSSNRQGIRENDEFELLKIILTKMISIFENDRQLVARYILAHTLKKQEIKDGFNEEELDEQLKESKNDPSKTKNIDKKHLIKKIEKLEAEAKEKDEYIKIVNGLASIGTSLGASTHELNQVKKKLFSLCKLLSKSIYKNIPKDSVVNNQFDPYKILKWVDENNLKLSFWINYILTNLKGNKRIRGKYEFKDLLIQSINPWKAKLKYNKIDIKYDYLISEKFYISIYPVDFNSLVINLIVNSFESFLKVKDKINREIIFQIKEDKENLIMIYSDNGIGLDSKYKNNPYKIFEPHESSKKNAKEEEIGVGLGMWIVDNVINYYKGEREIIIKDKGFKLKIKFPKKNIKFIEKEND